ncbi:MAG: LTA synthase family protein [Flavobacteriales bacterium]
MFRGPLTVLLLRLGSVAGIYTLLRGLFWWYNRDLFAWPPLAAYAGGVRFDLSAIAWLNLPWVLLYLIQPRPGLVFGRVQLYTFMLVNGVALFFNCVDIGYYAFSLKRSTADFLEILTKGNDTANLAPAFARDYWHLVLILIACLVAIYWAYRRIGRTMTTEKIDWKWRVGWRALAIGLLVLASRGGVQLIPLQPLDAARYAGATYLPVVLNTPFTLIMSLGKPTVVERNYMPQNEADALWPVVQEPQPIVSEPALSGVAVHKPNVVVIILESFSAVYSGRLSGSEGYMPFLDSLMGQSLNMTHAYANGRRSIDGIPAILASIPELMDESFITSAYASDPFTSLASVLGNDGYHTSFFHGGRNGTMGFDGFAHSAGFQRYVGLNEYPNPEQDNDKHWGIRDVPFLQFYARELNKEQQPFMSSVFTLSSHHPYELPAADAARFAGGTMPIHPTLRYADDALRQFFATARTMPWFANTLFIITADHTADIERNGLHSDKAIDYWIPLLYFMPDRITPRDQQSVTQHIDILPTALDLIGYDRPFFSFGHSAMRRQSPPYAIMASNGVYNIISAGVQVQFDGDAVLGAASLIPQDSTSVDMVPLRAAEMELYLKAAIQQFNGHVLRNALVAQPDVP